MYSPLKVLQTRLHRYHVLSHYKVLMRTCVASSVLKKVILKVLMRTLMVWMRGRLNKLNFTGQKKVLTNVLMSPSEDFMRSKQSSCEAEAKASW